MMLVFDGQKLSDTFYVHCIGKICEKFSQANKKKSFHTKKKYFAW